MNSEDVTLPLNEPTDSAPSTQPLLKELLADVRELKANMATKADLANAIKPLENAVERIENELVKVNVQLDGIEREQTLMRFGMDKIHSNALRHEERITML